MSTVLLEIGTEELPAGYVPSALTQLASLARTQLQSERIAAEDVQSWGTPRRLALFLTGVIDHQAPVVRELRGPDVREAFASNGEPTQAAMGFARSMGVSVQELRIKAIENDEFMMAIFRDEGRQTIELLPSIFHRIITSLTFQKTMRWGNSKFSFARPIRWIVALFNEQILPLTIGEVTSNRFTRGHRFLAPGEVAIATAADYPRIMDENQVVVNQATRHEMIVNQLNSIAQQEQATILDKGPLLEETVYRVEYPTALRGAIDSTFLSLPRELLLQVLRREQGFFPLATSDGTLLPAFIAVRNGDKAYLGTVREGYERVAHAKLLDARFFYEQDQQQALSVWADALHGVVFQEGLGTMLDKTKRIAALAGLIAAWLHLTPEQRQSAEHAAHLAKADLLSAIVTEFPALQGTMGCIYARNTGESAEIAQAIGEQYQPRSATDTIPASLLGRLLALADKMDTLVAFSVLGLIPNTAEDPYGIQQTALGILRILMEDGGYPLTLSQLGKHALRLLPEGDTPNLAEAPQVLERLFSQQLSAYLIKQGITPAIAKTVIATQADHPLNCLTMARFLQQALGSATLATAARLLTRLSNITKNFAGEALRPDLLSTPAEKALLDQYQIIAPLIEQAAAAVDYPRILEYLDTLHPTIEEFFAAVLVMTDDPQLRQARISLLWHVARLFYFLGDLSTIG